MNQKTKIEIFFKKGYTLDEKGVVLNPKGKEVGHTHRIKSGYLRKEINLRHEDSKFSICVHRIQAYLKFGDVIFQENILVRHLDNDSLNNKRSNIEIGTSSDNQMDIPKNKRTESACKASRKRQNLIRSYEDRIKIYNDLKNGTPYREIMKKIKISSGTLSYMKNKSIEYQEFLSGYSSNG